MRKLVWILVAFLSLAVSSTAWAGDVGHAKSGGFFAFFRNLFHSSDSAPSHPAASAPAKSPAALGQKKTKFIYLDDGSGTSDNSSQNLGGTSLHFHSSSLSVETQDAVTPNLLFEQDLAGVSGLFQPSTPGSLISRKTGSQLTMSFGPAQHNSPLSDLDISLISRAAVEAPDVATVTPGPDYLASIESRAYSLGLNVDFRGFYAGANYGRQQRDGLALGYRGYHGYDVGFGYQGHKWSTGIQISGYQKDSDILGFMSPDGVRTVQVGAAYSLWPWITFSGQFRYYDYNNRGSRSLLLDQSRVFTLGTSLNF